MRKLLKDLRAACNLTVWEKLPHKNRFFRRVTDLPLLFTFFSRYIQSRTCSGRRTQHLLIRAIGSDYEVSWPWFGPRSFIGWIYPNVGDHQALLHTNYISRGPQGFLDGFWRFFSYIALYKHMTPWGITNLDCRGLTGRIRVVDH